MTCALLASLLAIGCTGGSESNAAVEKPVNPADAPRNINPEQALGAISPAIPIYGGARYDDHLTRSDEDSIRREFGNEAEVMTLTTDDSFPQVFHYYTTYLAQFRAFPATDPYPSSRKQWRTLEVRLNEAMQDPFIPGTTIPREGRQVILQVVETEAEPRTVIRYILTPAAPPAPVIASSGKTEPKVGP